MDQKCMAHLTDRDGGDERFFYVCCVLLVLVASLGKWGKACLFPWLAILFGRLN